MIFKHTAFYKNLNFIWGIIVLLNFPLFSQQPDSSLSKKIDVYKIIPNLTEEEYRFNFADFLPLSLAEQGRLFTSAFRGMPPGFFEFKFDEAGNYPYFPFHLVEICVGIISPSRL